MALNWTPERHFVPGTVFTWVWLERDLCRNLSESEVARLRASLERRYRTVYEGREAVPDSLLYLYENGSVAGLKHGFALGLSVVSRRLFMVKVRHHDFEGNLAASSGDHVYVWILGRWWKLRDENMAIA